MNRNALRSLLIGVLAVFSPQGFSATDSAHQVDVELVIAVDISYSMDTDEQQLQRDGYTAALTSRDFIDAVRKGPTGRIAVTYVEWAGENDQRIVVPWLLIDGPEAAGAFIDSLKATPPRRASRTSISGALKFSAELLDQSPYRGFRRVIDVSGDGTNNQGKLIVPTRDDVLAKGITINGLPVMLKEANTGFLDIPNLDEYYEDCVVGGPGAFVVPARGKEQFVEAIRKKLLLEVAGRMDRHEREPRVIFASADKPRVSCTIGEKMWDERWGGAN